MMEKIIKYIRAFLAVALWAAVSIWSGAETVEIIDKHGLSIQLEDIAIIVSGVNFIGLVVFLAKLVSGQSVK